MHYSDIWHYLSGNAKATFYLAFLLKKKKKKKREGGRSSENKNRGKKLHSLIYNWSQQASYFFFFSK